MEGSTGNYSGASSSIYPPSLYDTSVSSASAGKSGWRYTPIHSNYIEREREQQEYKSSNQHLNEYRHQEKGHLMYPNSSRSMDNSEYKHNRDVAAMSDPGGTQYERNHGQSRSHIEYSRSEMSASSSSYYEPQQRLRKAPRQWQEKRHEETKPQYSNNTYSSAPIRRKSLSPPLDQQHTEEKFRRHQNSRDTGITDRDKSFVRANEGYHDGMYMSSPSYNERSLDSSSPTSAVNVKELKNQLWNNNEVLKVRVSSPPKDYRRIQQSLSPIRQSRRQGPISPPNNLPRFARSLSPRRRQYQHSSSVVDEAPSQIQKASSTMSETSYNSRFNSKFYEAALVAQKRVDGNNKAVVENAVKESEERRQYYQQQQEHRRKSFSRPLKEGDSNQYPHQNLRGNKSVPSSSLLPNISNRINNAETYKKAAEYYRRKDTGNNMRINKVGINVHRPPVMAPSPSSLTNDEQKERNQQKQLMPLDHGRSKNLSHYHREDGRSARKIRSPSPLLLERIRSFDHDYYHDSGNGIFEGQEQGHKSAVDRQDGHLSNYNWRGTNHHDNANGNNSHEFGGGDNASSLYIGNDEKNRRPQVASSTNDRFHNDRNHFDNEKSHSSDIIRTAINEHNTKGESHRRRSERPQDIDDEIGKDKMANLFDKLSAVNRENPESALAQIDSILRQESRSTNTQAVENSHDDGAKDVKTMRHNNYHTESNFTGRQYEDDDKEEVTFNNEDDDDDESSDVSSITNPTFQQGASKPYFSKQMDLLYIRENDHYNMHNTAQNSNLGEKICGDFNNLPSNPSTSSFRRPRPSHLQNYSKDVSKDSNATSRSEWKRQQLKKFPPPSTIKVKDDLVMNESPRQNSANFREKMLQKNFDNSRINKNHKVIGEQETSIIVHNKPKKALDKFIANKEGLVEKIRNWDELSSQLSKSRPEEDENTKGPQNAGTFSKRHPWDSNISMVQTKDTSMDNAVGVEAEMATIGHHYDSYAFRHDTGAQAEASMEDSRISNKIQKNHFEKARRNIEGRTNRNPFSAQSVASNQSDTLMKAQYPDISANRRPNIDMSVTGIPQFNPSEQQLLMDGSKHRNEKKSDNEGSSWVAMPPSSFFPDINDNFEPVSIRNSSKLNDLSESLGISRSGGHDRIINQVSTGANKLKIQNEDGVSEIRSITRLSCKTNGNKEQKLREKKRGFLRAFMEKKKTKASGAGYAASAAAGSVSGRSTSVESRGVKSVSQLDSNNRPRSTRSISKSNIRILPPPNGILEPTIVATTDKDVQSRAGNRSASSPKHRSSEKFRSSSMAQKFNRVMQLYDSDEA